MSPRLLLLIGVVAFFESSNAFSTIRSPMISLSSTLQSSSFQVLKASVENDIEDEKQNPAVKPLVDEFPDVDFLTFSMADHRPLGCTVEESLDPNDEYVFVTKIVPDGNAEKAGMQVGDVIVAVTGLFGEMDTVLLSGVDKIKSMVGAVASEDPLTIQVARGTEIFSRHESAVVDLCQSPGASDKEVENCVVDFLASGYVVDDDDDSEMMCDDDGEECMIDDMMNMWAEDLPLPPTTSGITDQPAENTAKKAKPWSSRSSPSGTYVRDPTTGQMRNIDPQ